MREFVELSNDHKRDLLFAVMEAMRSDLTTRVRLDGNKPKEELFDSSFEGDTLKQEHIRAFNQSLITAIREEIDKRQQLADLLLDRP